MDDLFSSIAGELQVKRKNPEEKAEEAQRKITEIREQMNAAKAKVSQWVEEKFQIITLLANRGILKDSSDLFTQEDQTAIEILKKNFIMDLTKEGLVNNTDTKNDFDATLKEVVGNDKAGVFIETYRKNLNTLIKERCARLPLDELLRKNEENNIVDDKGMVIPSINSILEEEDIAVLEEITKRIKAYDESMVNANKIVDGLYDRGSERGENGELIGNQFLLEKYLKEMNEDEGYQKAKKKSDTEKVMKKEALEYEKKCGEAFSYISSATQNYIEKLRLLDEAENNHTVAYNKYTEIYLSATKKIGDDKKEEKEKLRMSQTQTKEEYLENLRSIIGTHKDRKIKEAAQNLEKKENYPCYEKVEHTYREYKSSQEIAWDCTSFEKNKDAEHAASFFGRGEGIFSATYMYKENRQQNPSLTKIKTYWIEKMKNEKLVSKYLNAIKVSL